MRYCYPNWAAKSFADAVILRGLTMKDLAGEKGQGSA